MKNVTIMDHPLVKHKLSYLRDKNTNSSDFREIIKEASKLLTYEAMKDWTDLEMVTVETPVATTKSSKIINPPVIVSILRAGNGMLDGILSMLPISSVGHIGIYRDKFIKNTVEYYFKLPEVVKNKKIFICDPLIATADTMIAAIDRLKQYEVSEIKILCILISKLGLEKINHFHPDVKIITLNVENEVNELGYLIPGLGDAGDRLYQTK